MKIELWQREFDFDKEDAETVVPLVLLLLGMVFTQLNKARLGVVRLPITPFPRHERSVIELAAAPGTVQLAVVPFAAHLQFQGQRFSFPEGLYYWPR
jgi:hypothetical protein